MAGSLNTGSILFVLPHNSLQKWVLGQEEKKHHNQISELWNYKSWKNVSTVSPSHRTTHTHTHTHTHTCSCRRPTGSRLWCLWRPPSSCGSSSPGCRLCRWAARWGWGVASWCWNRPDLWPARAFLSDEASRHPHLRGEVKELITPAGGQAGVGTRRRKLTLPTTLCLCFQTFLFCFFLFYGEILESFPSSGL